MTETAKNQLVELLNNGLLSKFENLFAEKSNQSVSFKVVENYYRWSGHVVTLEENGDTAKKMLTSNSFLSMMFSDAKLDATLFYQEDCPYVGISFHISYSHPSGGSNGLDLLRAEYNIETGELNAR